MGALSDTEASCDPLQVISKDFLKKLIYIDAQRDSKMRRAQKLFFSLKGSGVISCRTYNGGTNKNLTNHVTSSLALNLSLDN